MSEHRDDRVRPDGADREGEDRAPRDFIRAIVATDRAAGKHGGRVATRFPPEPNGFLHIGHAKSICLNFGIARENAGTCNLRFDDTNPLTEDERYVASIAEDVRWLGFAWDEEHYASDYFERLYELARDLVRRGLAYVDSSTDEEVQAHRGTITEPGRPTRYRDRSVEENLDLFERMRAGEFPNGAHVLRAKIDLAAANMLMRDPILYRIRHAEHYRTGDAWPIYPMYDFTHCLSDAIEGITHSLCTLEFENNRAIYDWLVEALEMPHRPQQIEFARLNLSYTVLSKRKLLRLVEEGHVDGWDDPRMPTLAGLRRRGVTPEAIRDFCERIGVAKANSVVDVAQLEHSIRDDLNHRAPRVMAVLRPLRLVVENYPEGESEELDAPYWPRDVPREGSRAVPFSRELWIEQDDFRADPPKGYHRLAPGREVRLRYAYLVTVTGYDTDPATGEVTEVRCTYDPATRGGAAPDGRRVAGTVHWVSAPHALPAEVRLYDRLFEVEQPGAGKESFLDDLNPHSLEVLTGCRVEASLADAEPGSRYQFERQGYFYVDPEAADAEEAGERLVFNRTITLRDSWARRTGAAGKAGGAAGASGAAEDRQKARDRSVDLGRSPAGQSAEPTDPLGGLDAAGRAAAEELAARHGLAAGDVRPLVDDAGLGGLFEAAVVAGADPKATVNWTANELRGLLGERPASELPFGGGELAELLALVAAGTISTPTAKELLATLVAEGGSPRALVERRGLEQITDADSIAAVVAEVLAAHPDEVAAYRGGKQALLGFFIGQVMRRTEGRADPALVRRLVADALGA